MKKWNESVEENGGGQHADYYEEQKLKIAEKLILYRNSVDLAGSSDLA